MQALHAQYIVNEQGEQTAVVLSIAEYRQLLEWLEDLEDGRAFDAALQDAGTAIPLNEALAKLDAHR